MKILIRSAQDMKFSKPVYPHWDTTHYLIDRLDLDLPDWYDSKTYKYTGMEREYELSRIVGEYLKSKGFDSEAKMQVLESLLHSGVDLVPLVQKGFHGSAKELKQIGKDFRNDHDHDAKIQEEIDELFGKYYDESMSAYVFKKNNSKALADTLIYKFKQMYNPPTAVKKYNANERYHTVYVLK